METETTGKWFVVNAQNDVVAGTRGESKDECKEALCVQLNMLHGFNNDWTFWKKRGYKVRKD